MYWFYARGEGLLLGILGGGKGGGCRPVLQALNPISDQKMSFSTLVFRRFQTWPSSRSYVIITYIRAQTKNSSNPFRIRIFLFRSYSFGIETTTTLIRSRNTLENHTQFQIKMGKVYTRFQTKMAQKPYPLGLHIPVWLI